MLNATQEEIAFILDSAAAATWPNTPTTSTHQPQQYRYSDEQRSYNSYVNGLSPRPVVPAVRAPLQCDSDIPVLTPATGPKSARSRAGRQLCTKTVPSNTATTDTPTATVPTSRGSCATHRKSNPQDLTAGNPCSSQVSRKRPWHDREPLHLSSNYCTEKHRVLPWRFLV